MTQRSPSLRRKTARRAPAPAKPNEEKKARKPAYLKRKMAVSQPQDKEEQEADQVAKEVSRAPREQAPGPQEDKRMISSKPVPSAQRLLRRLNRAAASAEQGDEQKPVKRAAKPDEKNPAQRAAKPDEPKAPQRAAKPDEQKPVQRAAKPQEQKPAKVQRSVETEEPEEREGAPLRTKLRRKADAKQPEEQKSVARVMRETKAAKPEEDQPQRKLMRAEAAPEAEEAPKETAAPAAGETEEQPSLEERLEKTRGRGEPLPEAVLRDMERQFGQDLSHVIVHTDAEAAELCKELQARAFTIGGDIYFAPGEYAPETDQGRELLAHEMTHVVQQSGTIQQKSKIARKAPAGGAPASDVFEVTEPLEIPPIKSRHGPRYQAMARAGQLRRPKGSVSDQRATAQRPTWEKTVKPDESKIPDDQRPSAGSGYNLTLNTAKGAITIPANSKDEFLSLLQIPTWDATGSRTDLKYQVDHVVEHQLGGADEIENMELLDSSHNGSVGSSFRGEIRDAVERTIKALKPADPRFNGLTGAPTSRPSAADVLTSRETKFTKVAATGGHERRRTEATSTSWSRPDIEALKHVLPLLSQSVREREGSAKELSILSPTGALLITKIPHGHGQTTFTVKGNAQTALSGFKLQKVSLDSGYNAAAKDTPVGNVTASLDLGPSVKVANDPGPFPIGLIKEGDPKNTKDPKFAVRISSDALAAVPKSVDMEGASPVDLTELTVNRGLNAKAILRPTHPLLQGLQIPGQLLNGRLGIFYTLDAMTVAQKLPIPGVTVTDATVTLGFDGERLSVGGDVQFDIRNFGQGSLSAELDSEGNFGLAGRFSADTKLFDQAELEMWYRSTDGFGIGGTLAITTPDKIKGIKSASITASYSKGAFSAAGNVEPKIPGIQQAGLTVSYSEEAGLTIGGTLQLAANPAIRSGSIDVTLNKQGEDWKVKATGTAQPAIPGVDSQLTVTYDDGAFTAEFSGGFKRGRLSGTVTVGATNRAVGEDGKPSGDPMPDGALNIYGSGSATIQIAPWLQGTAGIRFDPNGEVTISGEIGIPNNVEIFARKEIQKSLLNIAMQIPIFPGIVAEIGGGLTAVAGIGPGIIDQLKIGITYNPSHEENTHVTGDAHLKVPADAGIRLSVRAGIGLGITGASATGGLEIGGTLGIEGAAEAGVHIDWTPATGLDLTATLGVHAQPSFTFDISGYVSVRALGFSVYDQRWQFASYKFGSDYRFGISLPVHYHEGEPFDVSLDDVQFEVPDISPGDILDGLIARIA